MLVCGHFLCGYRNLRSRLVHLFRRCEMFWEQRLEPVQRILRLLELRSRALNASLGGLDSEFQLFVLRAPYFDLLVERSKRGFRFIERLLIIGRVDLEQQIALFHQLVVLDSEVNDRAADARNDSDDIGARSGIVRSWMPREYTPDIKR